MPNIPDIQKGAAANAALWRPMRNALSGDANYAIEVVHNHASEYALEGQNLGAGPIFRLRNAAGTSMLEVTQTGTTLGGNLEAANLTSAGGIAGVTGSFSGTLTAGSRLALAPGSFAIPSMYFTTDVGADVGLYYAGTNMLGIATASTNRTVTVGVGNATGLVEIIQTAAAPIPGIYAVSGSFGTPRTPTGAPVNATQVLTLAGATYPAVEASSYVESGTTGYAVGVKGLAEGRADSTGLVGLMGIARSTTAATGSQAVTGLLVNSTGVTNSDHVQGAEIVVATKLNDGSGHSTPDQRIVLILSTMDNSHSRRATAVGGVDTAILVSRKATGGDFTNVQTFRSALLVGSHAGGVNGWALGDDSTIIGCDTTFAVDALNQTGYAIDLANTNVREAIIGSSTGAASVVQGVIDLSTVAIEAGGVILQVKSAGSDPAISIIASADAIGTRVGWVGIGVVPTTPLHIKTAEAAVVTFAGTTANFTTTSVGAAGGATALPATPLGYIRHKIGSTSVLIPYYTNA